MVLRSANILLADPDSNKGEMESRVSKHLTISLFFLVIALMLLCGCGHLNGEATVKASFEEANVFFNQGDYQASLDRYQQIIELNPPTEDRALFEMGIVYAYPGNEQKNYQTSLDCFQKLIKDYPGSNYRKDSAMMIFNINNVIFKDRTIAAQQAHIEILQQEINSNREKVTALEKSINTFEQKIKNKESEVNKLQKEVFALQKEPADRILIEKSERRLTLISKGKVLKTYSIALGGNPDGPKERQGDNKTPEGTYVIDSRNKNSLYHRSLHVSYPNEKDKKRAKQLGVSPGGDIMIHGIKNGFSWVGDMHTGVDWTKGCIAVTDEEIEEIDKLVPNGTIVEIRP